MDNYVITIARGFGTGGKQIGMALAKELGIECYENRILTLASQYSGYGEEILEDEKLHGSLFMNKLLRNLPISSKPRPMTAKFTSNKKTFEYQVKIIKQLAETESCVIIGKCADYVLKDYPNVVSVYIEAPRDYTRDRIMRRMLVSAEEADRLITKTDRYRADYYEFYTNGNYWTNPVNYDITLNSARLKEEVCIGLIKETLHRKLGVEI